MSFENEEILLFQPTAMTEQNLPELENEDDENDKSKYKKWYYKIILFGVFYDGRSASVVISGIEPYTYLKFPDKYQDPKHTSKRYKFKAKIEDMMRKHK